MYKDFSCNHSILFYFFVFLIWKLQCFFVFVYVKQVEEALEGVKNATNEQDLANRFKEFGKEMVKLNYVAARRQQVLYLGAPFPTLSFSENKTTSDLLTCVLLLAKRSSYEEKAP